MISSYAEVAKQVTDLCRWTCGYGKAEIDPGMSLTQDLGFDAVKLTLFLSDVEELYPGIALENWLTRQGMTGRDTINSIVQYLVEAMPPASAK